MPGFDLSPGRLRGHEGRRPALAWLAPVLLASVIAAGTARAQTIDPEFPVASGPVHSLALAGDTLYLAGDFTRLARAHGSMVALDAASGETVEPWPRFRTRLIEGVFPRFATAVLPDGAGGCYVGGGFRSVSGVTRTGVAHVRGDGSLDGWIPVLDDWGSVGHLVKVGGTIYLGGSFQAVNGQPRNGLAAVDAVSGAVLPWNPQAAGASGGNIRISAMATDGAQLFVAGTFETIGGQARHQLAALDLASGAARPWNPSANADVVALEAGDGVVYAGGSFSAIGGEVRQAVAALDPWDGHATSWNAGASAWAQVTCLELAGSTLYVGGNFTQLGGAARSRVVALDTGTALASGWQPLMDEGYVWSIAASGPDVYLGGWFFPASSGPPCALLAVDATSGAQTRWIAGADQPVSGLAAAGSRVFACGGFSDCGAVNRDGLAAIDLGTGSVLPWRPALDGPVWCLASHGSRVVAGGRFTTVDGQNRGGLAAFEHGSGQVTEWDPSQGVPNRVAHLATDGRRVYVQSYTGVTFPGQPTSRLAAVDADNGTALPWHPTIAGGAAYVSQLIATGGRVYLSGEFQSVNGLPRRAVVAVDPDSGALQPWNPGLLGAHAQATGYVDAMALRGARLYVSGSFTSNGGTVGHNLAALDTATAQVLPWTPAHQVISVTLAADDSSVFYGWYGYDFVDNGKNAVLAVHAGTGARRAWYPRVYGYSQAGPAALALHGADVIAGGHPDLLAGEYARPGLVRVRPTDTTAPAAAVVSPSGGESFVIGSHVSLQWQATDDQGIESVDLRLSRTGPGGPWELLAAGLTGAQAYEWTVTPPAASGACWLRVDARDHAGNSTSTASPAPFSLAYTTGVDSQRATAAFALEPPTPNPARSAVTVAYSLAHPAHVRVSVVDVQGREVQRLDDGGRSPGRHVTRATTDRLAPGLYFIRLRAPGVELARRFVVVR